MKILFINEVCGTGSTGKICVELAQKYEKNGHEAKIAYGRHAYVPEQFQKYAIRIGSDLDVKLHAIKTRLTDEHGFGSKHATKKFLEWAENYMPDVLWLHNLHGYYINIEMLFEWIKKHPELEVKWTLHDCWSFTGHCSHFTYAQCNKWKKQCFECEQKGRYPKSVFMDNSVMNFQRKQKAFCGVRNLTIVVPCKWLASMVKESFLKEYPVEVSYNSINTNIFKPTVSDFREKNGLEDKIVILGVANVWDDRKGIQDILKLASMLDNRYAIVLVGLSSKQVKQITKWNESTQKSTSIKSSHLEFSRNKDEKKLSGGVAIKPDVDAMYKAITGLDTVPKPNAAVSVSHIICMQRTTNAEELAAMYTMADYFVNPTYEDTYPTVNLEAKACGTYVITYDVGGAAETLERGLKNENYI